MTLQRDRIYVEHEAKVLATMAGAERPACDGMIVKLAQVDNVLACTVRSNPLGGQWLLDAQLPGNRVVTWSGNLAEQLFEQHPMTWLTPGHESLAGFCDEIAPQLQQHNKVLCFQPHSRHVLSDAQSSARFLRERSEEPFEVALAPASLLEPSMLAQADDHLIRMFELLGSRCSMVILSDVLEVDDDVKPVPLGEGQLPRELLLELLQRQVPNDVPLVLSPNKVSEQLAWLGVSS